ncbi:MAG TPA: hypothetical protein VHW65_12265 [Gemmatimonadales bacterium]|nr:hypothetical protein [Gemmatimonadales bacterium]
MRFLLLSLAVAIPAFPLAAQSRGDARLGATAIRVSEWKPTGLRHASDTTQPRPARAHSGAVPGAILGALVGGAVGVIGYAAEYDRNRARGREYFVLSIAVGAGIGYFIGY